MRTKTTLLAIFVIVTAIALVTAGSITASTLAVKKKSTTTTKKTTGSKKTTKSPKTSKGGGATATTAAAAGTGNSTLGGTDKFSKLITCMRLFSGPLTRANVDQCYTIVYGTSSTSSVIGSLPNAGPTSRAGPKTSNIGPSSSSSTTLGTP
jgi:hypothetical protein